MTSPIYVLKSHTDSSGVQCILTQQMVDSLSFHSFDADICKYVPVAALENEQKKSLQIEDKLTTELLKLQQRLADAEKLRGALGESLHNTQCELLIFKKENALLLEQNSAYQLQCKKKIGNLKEKIGELKKFSIGDVVQVHSKNDPTSFYTAVVQRQHMSDGKWKVHSGTFHEFVESTQLLHVDVQQKESFLNRFYSQMLHKVLEVLDDVPLDKAIELLDDCITERF